MRVLDLWRAVVCLSTHDDSSGVESFWLGKECNEQNYSRLGTALREDFEVKRKVACALSYIYTRSKHGIDAKINHSAVQAPILVQW
jgi:hypothetical protein